MLPETIDPRLLDMTHMFIATTLWGRQLKVDTYKFVLKNDRVGLCYAGVAKANQDDISKLMDPFLVVEDLPMNEDFETSEQTVPFVAYMPDVFSAHAEVVPSRVILSYTKTRVPLYGACGLKNGLALGLSRHSR